MVDPRGLQLEQYVGNGAESVGAIADTIAEARADAERKLPHLAVVASERVVSFQETKTFKVSAPEYETAQERGKKLMGEPSAAPIRLNSFDSCKTDMPLLDARSVRSEERRVGKEGRG